MVLPEVVFFPHNIIPLNIFEPRYRSMLNDALEGSRMFALSQPCRHNGRTQPRPVGGVGLIRACVQNEDGTSNLILQGIARVRFKSFTKEKPYFVGKLDEIQPEDTSDSIENEALATKILEQVDHIQSTHEALPQELKQFLAEIKDFNMLVDIVAGSFVKHAERKQQLLETSSLNQRLHLLAVCLYQEYPASHDLD